MRRARPHPSSSSVAAVVFLTIVVGLVGCGHSGHRRTGAAAATSSTSPPTTTTTAPAAPRLVTAGTAPRRRLRFALRAGSVHTVAVSSQVEVTQELASGDRLVEPPTVIQEIRFRVSRVDARGATVSFKVLAARVDPSGPTMDPARAAVLTKDLQPIVGAGGTGLLVADGRFTDVRLHLPAGLPKAVRTQADALASQLGALTPRLPDDAVGVGGSWSTDDRTTIAGITVHQQVTYVVTAIEGSVVTYRSTTVATNERQPMTTTNLPVGATATVASGRLTGTATGSIDLTSPVGTLAATLQGRQDVAVTERKMAPVRLTQELRITDSVVSVR